MSRPLAALAAASVLALAGCATPSAPPGPAAGEGPPNLWTGRFAATVTEAGDGAREERSSGRFSLRVEGPSTELELSSPLGQTIAQVRLDDGRATLLAADGKSWQAPSAEALTEQVFGWRVPLANLPDWLEGRIAEPTERDGSRVVAGLDHGWSVRIDASEAGRPRRLALDWPAGGGAGERRLSLRLVVDSALRSVARP
ncbi:MAG TPA: outer membrane lipoprotein LolB [Burkholderiaceae bacterium]|jgi:outer membrane lipoprotein LolB|nr:outer membrane lipoprotein LolB [Burkholderiaceae bacterium]